ncbi:MAG: hypothetical protein WBC93_12350 [Sulfitobacter sp.]
MRIDVGTFLKRSALAIASTFLPGIEAHAQQQFLGQWYCEFSYTEYNNSGKRSSGFTMVFGTVIQSDGSFYAEGQEQSIMGNQPFQAQGRWFIENGSRGPLFNARGQRSGPSGISPFGYIGFLGPDNRVLYHNQDIPNPQTGRIMSRSSTECTRTG